MLLHCPTCQSAVEAALPPGAMASCPFCQNLFQVPPDTLPPTIVSPTVLAPTDLAPTVIAPTVVEPRVPPTPEEMPIIVREPVACAADGPGSGLSATLL